MLELTAENGQLKSELASMREAMEAMKAQMENLRQRLVLADLNKQ